MRLALWGLAVFTSIATAADLASDPHGGRIGRAFEDLATRAGLGIEQVSIIGQRMTDDRDIYETLDLSGAQSMLRLDGAAARAGIEDLPWIDHATIARLYPNRLEVRVTERRAFAVWRFSGDDRLVDATGRVLAPVTAGSALALPHIAGAGAPLEAATLFNTLARFPKIEAALVCAERIAGRRWTLHLSGGVIVLLPADRESAALALYEKLQGRADPITTKDVVIDLRAAGRVTVEPKRAVAVPYLASG